MELQTTVHRELPAVRALAAEWQSLHETSGATNPFTGPDWALPWLERFVHDTRHTPFVVEVRSGDRLVGVAPSYLRSVGRGLARAVQPVGTGDVWVGPYELPGLLTAQGLERDATRAVVRALCAEHADWDWAHLLLGGGSGAPWLEPEWLPDWSFTVQQRRTRGNVEVDLTVDDVYAGRRNLKESFRRARNRLTRDLGADRWSVTRTTDPAEVGGALARLAVLHGSRAGLRDGRPVHADVLLDPRVLDLLHDVVGRMARRKAVSVYELALEGTVEAALLVLHTDTASYSSLSGVAERAWPYSAVTHLQSVAVEDARAAGHRVFDLSCGPNQAKLRWSSQVRTATEFTLLSPRRRSQALHLAVSGHAVWASYREARRAHRC
ncbi:GNAT family N-acetyltransferase [Streptomyces sp. NP160]|uniref:GNAT family N-acetyltransferase n=1 Tax=Streptomyces sp. NP160 TaxID=2586637 RepID=UPI0015D56FDF|nr:GNAT family N-acetyltransferase [Streptomyces sp. NP160]